MTDPLYDAVRAAVIKLIRAGEIRSDSSAEPVYFVLYDVAAEQRARELAAAVHVTLYGTWRRWPGPCPPLPDQPLGSPATTPRRT
ncbi:hypothetical protein AB5J72_22770 [Streptomyces sp. CG1]|uniref:hypothetical protein n=1 Tax=Streptomyces sp. CG1 TaxID=1287523 RepID=UPI0034E285AC